MKSTGRRVLLAAILGSAACFGPVAVARANDASVRTTIEYQDDHALKLSSHLRALQKIKRPTATQEQTLSRLSRAFAVKADAAADEVAKTTASTTEGRAGKAAWVQSVRDLAILYRDVATENSALAAGNSSTAKHAATKALKEQGDVTRLDLQAEHDLDLPKGD